jgi:hypothetical protein
VHLQDATIQKKIAVAYSLIATVATHGGAVNMEQKAIDALAVIINIWKAEVVLAEVVLLQRQLLLQLVKVMIAMSSNRFGAFETHG